MAEEFKPSNRRGFLKKVATTGAITTGLAASAGTASAATCKGFRVLGRQDGTSYSITFPSWSDVSMGWDTEGGDSKSGTTVSGGINNGKEDHYSVSRSADIRHAEINGSAVIQWVTYNCDDNVVGSPPESTRIDVTGHGDYTVGWWGNLTKGNNLESGDVEACYPTYSSTGDPQITCEIDPEGIVTGYVDTPWSSEPQEVEFGTGHVAGYTDTFFGMEGANYLAVDGNVTVDISYTN